MNIEGMMKNPVIFLIVTWLFLMFFGGIEVNAEEKQVDINSNKHPDGYFFQVDNLKPGDWMPRDIMIFNQGKEDFQYSAFVGEKKPDEGLIEKLELLVKKDNEVLYEGLLKDFKWLTPRKLTKGNSELLFFQVTMPSDLGNEFQDSSAEVEIIFKAESLKDNGGGDPPGEDNPPGDGDPPGGNNPPGKGNPPGDDDPPEDGNPPGDNDPPGDGEPPVDNNPPGDGEPPVDNNPPGDGEPPGDNDPPGDGEPPGDSDPPGDGELPVDNDLPGDGDSEEESEEYISENPEGIIPISPKMTENLLPNTATNIFNLLAIGGLLLGIGGLLLFYYLRKLKREV